MRSSYIQKGKAKVAVVSEQGKEAVVAILGPDDFFGEDLGSHSPCLLGNARAMKSPVTCRWRG